MLEITALALVLFASLAGTALLRRYALAHQVLDVPNARSSHLVPTPRGGGVAIVIAFGAAMTALAVASHVNRSTVIALDGAGVLTALVGFADDHGHIAARWRLLAHFAVAGWLVAWLGPVHVMLVAGRTMDPGIPGIVVTMIALVWLLNLYNFMDGIDGIAGVEAMCVTVGAAVLYARAGISHADIVPLLLLAAAALGFLFWNFPPARIFLGDAGSGFIGIVLGGLALRGAVVEPRMLWCWLILLGVFIVDATTTLLRRLARGDRVYDAHRNHAYQRAARMLGGHLWVTLAVGAIDICWLLPVALLVESRRLEGISGLLVAYLPLVACALWLRAGVPEPGRSGAS